MSTLIPIFTFFTVVGIGGAFIVAVAARRAPLKARLRGGGEGPAILDEQARRRSSRFLGKVGKMVSGKGPSKTLQEELIQAGYHDPGAASVFLGAKSVMFAVGLSLGFLFVLPMDVQFAIKPLVAASAGFVFSILPNLVLKARMERRKKDVKLHLPDAIDLLEICVSSGMGLEMAWNAVGEEVRRVSTILADEMALANLEMHLGADRASAMRHMAERTGAEEISSLVATLLQSEKFGTSIADALRVFAESMRIERSQKAEEAAEKMAVKLLFPLILFIFPAMMIVCTGSAAIQIYNVLLGGR